MPFVNQPVTSTPLKPIKRLIVSLCCASGLLLLSGCGDSELEKMDDFDLATEYNLCLVRKPSAPGKATACENMRRECERRKKELGRYVCPSASY